MSRNLRQLLTKSLIYFFSIFQLYTDDDFKEMMFSLSLSQNK